MSFFQMGTEAIDNTIATFDAEKAARDAARDSLYRFWLKAKNQRNFKPGMDSAIVIFLADTTNCVTLYEHNLKLNGRWGNTFFCLRNQPGQETCPICESGDTAYKATFIPIVDRSEYTSSRNGKTYKDQIKLMVAKPTSMKQIRFDEQEYEGLKYKQFKVIRTDKDQASIGDKFIFKGQLEEEKVVEILQASGQIPGDVADEENATLPNIEFSMAQWQEILGELPDEETLASLVGGKANEFDEESEVDFD